MTPEPDQISKLIHQSKGKGSSLGFSGDDGEVSPREVTQVTEVRGRKHTIAISEGIKKIVAKARLVRTLDNGLEAIRGAEGSSIDVDDLKLLLNSVEKRRVTKALRKDSKNKKQNLQGK